MRLAVIYSILMFFWLSEAKENIDIIYKDFECNSLSKKVENVTCDVAADNGIADRLSLQFDIIPGSEIDNVYGNFSLMKNSDSGNAYSPAFGMDNVTIDFCSYLGGGIGSVFLTVFAGGLKKYGNIFHSCPFSGHTYAKDLFIELEKDMFPENTPAGDFVIDVVVFMKINKTDEKLMEFKIYFEIRKE